MQLKKKQIHIINHYYFFRKKYKQMHTKFIEFLRFFKNVRSDLKNSSDQISIKDKKKCWNRIILNIFIIIWNAISAPFIYPVWYLFRQKITKKIYKNTSWQDIHNLMKLNETNFVKQLLLINGRFFYWLWTYGDCEDPLGRGGLPNKCGKNTFLNRYKWSAIRNPRFNINYMNFRTGTIVQVIKIIDTRDFNYLHKSFGIGDSPDGIYFKWMKDNNNKWYFIYEDNNSNHLFYFGYTGLLRNDIGNCGGRFELSYRKTESSYFLK